MGPIHKPWGGRGGGVGWGQQTREIPRTTGLVTDNSGPGSHAYSTLYFPGKHLLSSLAQKLASNLPPQYSLVMPIRVYTALSSRDGEERKWKGDTGREMENEGIEREG